MISPGEIDRGLWVIPENLKKDKDFSVEENPFEGMVAVLNMEPVIPHVVLAVELPYIVVADCFSNSQAVITKIWKSNEKNLQEVTPEFVKAYDVYGFNRGMEFVRKATEAKKMNKSSDAA